MKKQTLLTLALFAAATTICTPQDNKSTTDYVEQNTAVNIDENSDGYKISQPDTGPPPLQCVITGSSSICLGTPGTLTSVPSGGTPPYTFLWSNGQVTQTIFVNPVVSTTFTVTVTDALAAHSNCNKLVTVNLLPPVLITGNSSVCNGSTTQWTASGGLNFSWSPTTGLSNPNTSNPLVGPTSTTTYTVTVTSTAGCSATATKTITVNPLPSATITAGGPTTFCDGLSVTLSTGTGTNRTYQWLKGGNGIGGATGSSYTAFIGGNYKVTVTNSVTGCSKTTNPATLVSVNPLPVALITPSGTITFCAGQSALLTATSQFGYTFQWKRNNVIIPNSVTNTLTVTTAGRYQVVVTNAFFCLNTSKKDTVVIPCRESMPEVSIPDDEKISDLMIYPNPVKDYLEFSLTSTAEKSKIEILNMVGSVVLTKTINRNGNANNAESFDVSNFPAGIYVFKVVNETGQQVKKFVKE